MNQQAAPCTAWSKRFIDLLTAATRELRRHSDHLPIPSEDRDRCVAATGHLGALLSLLDGQPIDRSFLEALPAPIQGPLLECCRGDWDAARKYAFGAIAMVVRSGFEPHDFGIGLGDLPAQEPRASRF